MKGILDTLCVLWHLAAHSTEKQIHTLHSQIEYIINGNNKLVSVLFARFAAIKRIYV